MGVFVAPLGATPQTRVLNDAVRDWGFGFQAPSAHVREAQVDYSLLPAVDQRVEEILAEAAG